MKRIISLWLIISFIATTIMAPQQSFAQEQLSLPVPGTMVNLSPAYVPVLIKGLKVHPENPLLFDFILDTGKSGLKVTSPEFKAESEKLIKYFLASLTIKEDDLWVNLSPYEKDRMIPQELGQTELGRDMLAQDYILKQLTASLIYPEKQLGKEFWSRVYAKAQQMYGTSNIPVNTFNKVWIVADKAKVLERNNAAYVIGAHLKVMLEEDYLALNRHSERSEESHSIASKVIKQIILPELEREVNQGQNFASLRQMFYSMILATWYKQALKNALLNQVFSNKNKIAGVGYTSSVILSEAKDLNKINSIRDSSATPQNDLEVIYQQYLKAYKKGVFNYIKEDPVVSLRGTSAASDEAISKGTTVARKYFSGGVAPNFGINLDREQTVKPEELASMTTGGDFAMETVNMDRAQKTESEWRDYIRASLKKKRTVLLIDDNENYRTGWEELLKGLNLNVLVAGNYVDAIGLFSEHINEIGLVITDDVMPRDESTDMPEFWGNAIRREVIRKGKSTIPVIWQSKEFDVDTLDSFGLKWHKNNVGENLRKLLEGFDLAMLATPGAQTIEPIIIRSGQSAKQVFEKKFPEYQNNPVYNPALWGEWKNPQVMRYDLKSYAGFDDKFADFKYRSNKFLAQQIIALAQSKVEDVFFLKNFFIDLRLLGNQKPLEVLTAFAEHMAQGNNMEFYIKAVANQYTHALNMKANTHYKLNRQKEIALAQQYVAVIKMMWERWLPQGAGPIVVNLVNNKTEKLENETRLIKIVSVLTGKLEVGMNDRIGKSLSQNPDQLVLKIAESIGRPKGGVTFEIARRQKQDTISYQLDSTRSFPANYFSVSKGINIVFSDGLIVNIAKPHTDYVTVSITSNLNEFQKEELFKKVTKAIMVLASPATLESDKAMAAKHLKFTKGIVSFLDRAYGDDTGLKDSVRKTMQNFISSDFSPKLKVTNEIDILSDAQKIEFAREALKDQNLFKGAYTNMNLEQWLLINKQGVGSATVKNVLGTFMVNFDNRMIKEISYLKNKPDLLEVMQKRWKAVYALLWAAELLSPAHEVDTSIPVITSAGFRDSPGGRFVILPREYMFVDLNNMFVLFNDSLFKPRKDELDQKLKDSGPNKLEFLNNEMKEWFKADNRIVDPRVVLLNPERTSWQFILNNQFFALTAREFMAHGEPFTKTDPKEYFIRVVGRLYLSFLYAQEFFSSNNIFLPQDLSRKSPLLKRLITLAEHNDTDSHNWLVLKRNNMINFLAYSDYFIERLTGKNQRNNRGEVKVSQLEDGMKINIRLYRSVSNYLQLMVLLERDSDEWRRVLNSTPSKESNYQGSEELRKDMLRNINLLRTATEVIRKNREKKSNINSTMTNGGIDLNAKNLSLDIAKENNGVEMNIDPALLAEFKQGDFSGIVPVIIRIIPIKSPLTALNID